jgi:hypothetical protein
VTSGSEEDPGGLSRYRAAMIDYWVLEGQTPVPEPDLLRWGRWFESGERTVARTWVRGGCVSTVFLGLNHNFFGSGPPLLFESMLFVDGDAGGEDLERYSTWSQAEAGHLAMVAKYGGEIE